MSSHNEIVEQNEWVAACLDLRGCFVARESPSPELAGRLARAEQAKRDRQASDPNCAHNVLARAFGLSATQLELVWLSVALATDAEAQSRAVELGLATNEVEIEAARQIIYGSDLRADALDELCESATPFRLGLLERTDAGKPNTPFGKQTWACSRRLLTWLFGNRGCAPELARFASCPSDAKALSELHLPAPSIEGARSAVLAQRAIIVASGPPSLGRRTLLRAAAKEINIAVLEVEGNQLAKDHEHLARQLKLIARECKLLERVPLVRNIDRLVDEHDQTRVDMVGSELVGELDGLVLVTCGTQRPAMRWDRPCVVVEVKQPTSLQRGTFWLECLGQGTEEDVEFLASNYPLAPALIHAAASAATSRAIGRSIQPEDIFAGVRAVLDDRLGDFATRIEVSQSWDDLVLPTDQFDAISYLLARIRQRRTVYEQWGYAAKVGKGLGTSALFSGPPGTGKTMVAALIAKDLGLDLYQVDISKVVSKWIGETERNLATLFDAAEAGGAIILFDEADSLFGKRTEVKSSNDRYANLETNYLLQRLESFTGICLLTSNHESSIDPAFQRRLSLHLRFELPEAEEREHLWRAMLPAAAPVAPDLDLRGLGQRFVMSGGYIRNAALRAAFMAADEGASITTRHLELAARHEYEGMGKIVGTTLRSLA